MREDKVFLDTNVLVYAHDKSSGEKFIRARELVFDLWKSKNGILSTQVIQEFYTCITKKITEPLSVQTTKDIITQLLQWQLVVNDGETILAAIDLHLKYKYSFWDSMIIKSAINGGANLLLSEDLSHGQIIEGVKIENPFL